VALNDGNQPLGDTFIDFHDFEHALVPKEQLSGFWPQLSPPFLVAQSEVSIKRVVKTEIKNVLNGGQGTSLRISKTSLSLLLTKGR
jgi:hypothetical protein